jgi:hypothetical protein
LKSLSALIAAQSSPTSTRSHQAAREVGGVEVADGGQLVGQGVQDAFELACTLVESGWS